MPYKSMSLKKKAKHLIKYDNYGKYNMNKRSEPLFQKSNFSPPRNDKFFELLY